MKKVKTINQIDDQPVELIAESFGTQVYHQINNNNILYVCHYDQVVTTLNITTGKVEIDNTVIKTDKRPKHIKVV